MNSHDKNPKKPGGIEQFLERNEMAFPYQIILSLEKIIQSWEQKLSSEDPFIRKKAEFIMEMIEQNPNLRKPELSPEDVKGKEDIIKKLFSDTYSIDLDETQAFAVCAPFSNQYIYKSKNFSEAYQNAISCDQTMEMVKEFNPKLVNAFAFILKEVYDADIGDLDIPFVLPAVDPKTGLGKYYKVHLACADYSTVIAKKKSKEFENQCFDHLIKHNENPKNWIEHFPAKDYVFKGVSLITLINITEQETLNRIQNILLKNSTLSQKTFEDIGRFASDYMATPDTQVGVVAFDKNLNVLEAEKKFGLSIMMNIGINLKHHELAKIVQEFKGGKKLLFIDSHNADPVLQKFHNKLAKKGISNLVLAPMYKESRMIGIFEITMEENHVFSAFYVNKLYRLVPLFELALDRSVENVNNQIQKIIKDNCTAIHPSVEWKFFTEAVKLYENTIQGEDLEQMDDIIFEDVIPLYGLSDIRNSSVQRGACIKADLLKQLRLAEKTLTDLNGVYEILILNKLSFQVNEKIKQLEEGIGSSEDEDIYGFLEKEVNKLLRRLLRDDRYDSLFIQKYFEALDDRVGILYQKRKDFDRSVTMINLEIAKFLNHEQIKLQKIYPHYFDIYQTDGVDYNIYMGKSIAPDLPYHNFYLKNLRLWQLSSMCKIVALLHSLKKELPIVLETAQLILVQNLPMTIKFRYEEKRFDIDSAYNARYEIVKKRIDKATIAGTGERLTQPGTIAIVYSNNSILKEYVKYVEFLQHQGIITSKVEYLELEELQGTDELRALRIQVNLESKTLNDDLFTEKILEKIQA